MAKKNVPELRFKGFSGDWEEKKLGEVCDSLEYGLNAAATEYDGIHKYIRITDIDDDSRSFISDNITSPDIDFSKADSYVLKNRNILFARTGASVGKTYIYNEEDGLIYYAGFLIRAVIEANSNSEFIFQNTLTTKYDKFIKVTSQRSGQPGVNAQEYAYFSFFIPEREEQDMLARFFRNLDSLITLQSKKYDKLLTLKKAMLGKMFPRAGANVPEVRFEGFSGDWESKKLGELALFSKGYGYSKSDLKAYGTPIILYGRLYTNYRTSISDIDTYAVDKPNSVYSTGAEVIVPSSGESAEDIARASVVEKHGVLLGGDLNIIKSYDELDSVFLALSISHGERQEELSRQAQGKSVVHLHNSDLQEITLLYPNLTEQTAIGNYFKNLDALITLENQKLEKLKTIKKSLLDKMFV